MDEMLMRLLDEREIARQLVNYARAMDRCDKAIGRAVFHPDAEVDYGAMFQGSGHAFVDFAIDSHAQLETHLHRISNVSIAVDGDRAGSETYVDARFLLMRGGVAHEMMTRGRYVDRWEKRGGRWAIQHRRYEHAMDGMRPLDNTRFNPTGRRDPSDSSYAALGETVLA